MAKTSRKRSNGNDGAYSGRTVRRAAPARRKNKKTSPLREANLQMKWCLPIWFKLNEKKGGDEPDEIMAIFTRAQSGASAWKMLNAVQLAKLRGYLKRHGVRDWTS